jgi:dihydrofolate synthase/folylpolyglutamate synthase
MTAASDPLARLQKRILFGVKPGLARVRAALARLGNPQSLYPVVHIAGTNGKGSTAAMLSAMLREAGYRVGLFTSPHLVRFAERIRVDGHEISDAQLAEALARALADESLTFFEVATVAALDVFARQSVDIAVVEAGLGGRLDATNVVSSTLAVITSIGLDHQHVLGPDLVSIAAEKAGIFADAKRALCADSGGDVAGVFKKAAATRSIPLALEGRDFRAYADAAGKLCFRGRRLALDSLNLTLEGEHQLKNAGLALAAAEILAEQGFALEGEDCGVALSHVKWPGRLERLGRVFLDCAHNADASMALALAMRKILSERGQQTCTLLFGALSDKPAIGLLAPLLPLASELILTEVGNSRQHDPHAIRELLDAAEPSHAASRPTASVVSNLEQALEQALSSSTRAVLVTGSAYLVGRARAILLEQQAQSWLADPAG